MNTPNDSTYQTDTDERNGWTQYTGAGRYNRAQTPSTVLGAYVPPNSIEAEQSTLGAMLIERAAIDTASAIVVREDFYRDTHQILFDVIRALIERSQPVDLITVQEELKNRDKLDAIGGISYLTSLFETVPTAANVEYYAKIVQEKSTLRKYIGAALEIIGMARGEVDDIGELERQAALAIDAAANRRTGRSRLIHVRDLLQLAEDEADKHFWGDATACLSTGYWELDGMLGGGMHNSDLIILAARPSIGKSALKRGICLNVAVEQSVGVAMFSAEMSGKQVATSTICTLAEIEYRQFRNRGLSEEDWQRYSRAKSKLTKAPLFIRDLLPMKVSELVEDCRRLRREADFGLITIDYLQLIRPDKDSRSRVQDVGEVSRGLKDLARMFDCPVLVLSSLNRACEARDNKRPMLSDLRESGDIESDADVVLLAYRDAYYQAKNGATVPADVTHVAEIHVAKNRMGPTGTIKLGFLPCYTAFSNWRPQPVDVPRQEAFDLAGGQAGA